MLVTDGSGFFFWVGCGPTSLNVLVRKLVAAQIDPAKIRKGDMRGQISLISEGQLHCILFSLYICL